jgi:CNT family concentrative nucleoside transporter
MLVTSFPDIAGHLIAASVMSAPTSLAVAKLLLPETEVPKTSGKVKEARDEQDSVNLLDAATRGAGDGLRLALNVGAMLLAFVALVAMLNHLFGLAGGVIGVEGLSMQRILGWIFWPIAWLLGVPAAECGAVGRLLGERMVLNEFVAYLDLAGMLERGDPLSYRGVTIASYALCGFANFGSIAIAIGGIGAIAEGRRKDLARIGMRAMIGGTISTLMVAAVAGILL